MPFIGSQTALHQERFFFRALQTLLLTLLLSACATGPSYQEQQWIDRFAKAIAQLHQNQGFTGWPRFNLSEHEILLLDETNQHAHSVLNGTSQSVDYESLVAKIPAGRAAGYTIMKGSGEDERLILFVNSKDPESLAKVLSLATHEGFHAYLQTNQQLYRRLALGQTRADIYPLETFPRYFRHEIVASLRNFLESHDRRWLNKASGWYYTWVKQFPHEHRNYADRDEGSAEYFSFQARTHLNLIKGSKAWKEGGTLPAGLVEAMEPGKIFGLSSESYLIGILAGLCLDQIQLPGWKERVQNGEAPIAILTKAYKPLFQRSNQEILNLFLQRTVQEMELIDQDGRLDQAIRSLASNKGVRLVIRSKGAEISSFTTSGFYTSFFDFPGLQQVTIASLLSPVDIKKSEMQIQLPSSGVWVMGIASACGPDMATILPLKSEEFQFLGNQVRLTGRLEYQGPYLKRVKQLGLDWICL